MSTKKEIGFILGGAISVFDDLKKAYALCNPDIVIAINDIVTQVEEVDMFATMHPDKAEVWLKERSRKGLKPIKKLWTTSDKVIPANTSLEFEKIKNNRGGSGLLAIYVLKTLGYKKKILCGVPMSPELGHYFDKKVWNECGLYRAVWERHDLSRRGVRSFSGWTSEQYGIPDKDWLVNVDN